MSIEQQSSRAIMVDVQGLSKQFGEVCALDKVSFQIHQGEWIAMMGPSGSGKTTLINILGGLDSPTGGNAFVAGLDVAGLSEKALTRYRAEKVGFVFQQFHLVPYLTALENVMLAQYLHSTPDEADARRALERVGLGQRLEHRPSQLSGGEQQRVAVARALINQPKLLLADEPTGNLDDMNERIVLDLFRELHAEGHTILMVTHNIAIGAMADRHIRLEHGHVIETPALSPEEEAHYDHLLEQIWVCREKGLAARPEHIHLPELVDAKRLMEKLDAFGLIEVRDDSAALTERGLQRARDVVRRRRLAEKLFTDTFAIPDEEVDFQACKFEHIISPELDEKICAFLGHPKSCPHGNPIPPGPCCPSR